MRELFKICRKRQVFELSWCFLRLEGVTLVGKGVEWAVLMCQGQTGKFPA